MAAKQKQLEKQEAEQPSAEQVEPTEQAGEIVTPPEPIQSEQEDSVEQEADPTAGLENGGGDPTEQDEADVETESNLAGAEEEGEPNQQNPGQENLDRILSMKVPVIVRIARKRISVGEVLKFNTGSVIQFEQDAEQHIDLMVNNAIIGLGQAVKLGENFGLKITEIADVADTIKSLGGQN
jgi:flagellar motor switch protein FliN/FliY